MNNGVADIGGQWVRIGLWTITYGSVSSGHGLLRNIRIREGRRPPPEKPRRGFFGDFRFPRLVFGAANPCNHRSNDAYGYDNRVRSPCLALTRPDRGEWRAIA